MADETQDPGAAQGAAPATIEEATATIADLQNQFAAAKTAADADAATIADLQGQLSASNERADEFQAAVAEANEVIDDLKVQLAEALNIKANANDKPVIDLGGEKWQVIHGAHPFSVADIVANPELATEIIKIEGQNALVKL